MKLAYWGLALVSIVLIVLGLFVFSEPLTPNISRMSLAEWYTQNTIFSFIIGALIGLVGALIAIGLLKFRARESAAAFYSRVASVGLATGVVAVIAAVAFSLFKASRNVGWQIASSDRIALVLDSGRYLAVPSAALLGTLLLFAVVTRARTWSGTHALA